MSKYLAYLRCVIPPGPDATAKQIFGWRCGIASTAVLALLGVVVIFGALERFGASGFARAADVDQKIEKALAPVNARLLSIETSQKAQGLNLDWLVKDRIAKNIYDKKQALCRAQSHAEKQPLLQEITELQDKYEEVAGKGKHATEPDCELS